MPPSAALIASALFLALVPPLHAHPEYIKRCPNGAAVPNFPAIGHKRVDGGGDTNAFGDAWGDNNDIYAGLCSVDSDGDGQSNGFELGDECCLWGSPADNHLLAHDSISHPGIASLTSARPACYCNGTLPFCSCCQPPPSPAPSHRPNATDSHTPTPSQSSCASATLAPSASALPPAVALPASALSLPLLLTGLAATLGVGGYAAFTILAQRAAAAADLGGDDLVYGALN